MARCDDAPLHKFQMMRHGVVRSLSASTSASSSLDARAGAALVNTYGPASGVRTQPHLRFTRGEGVFLVDETSGRRYLDMSAGIAVNVLGHGDRGWAEVLYKQALEMAHVSNLYNSEPAVELAEKLLRLSPGFSRAFFCNSGTEANEGALKFARLGALAKNRPDKSRVIAFKSSFHGRSLGALSVTYKPAIRTPFDPLLHRNVDFCEFNNLEQVAGMMDRDVMAVIVEPVQGEGGINPAQPEFLRGLRALCDQHGAALIFDEIQIGLGRSGGGHLWGHQHYGVVPDLLTAAKPLANGLPIGAVLLGEAFHRSIPPTLFTGAHGTTFGGNPLVCRAASYVLDKISTPEFLNKAKLSGRAMIAALDREVFAKFKNDKVTVVRRPIGNEALYAGVQLTQPVASQVVLKALDMDTVFITAGDKGDTIRICPPLIITPEEVTKGIQVLAQALHEEAYHAALSKSCPVPAGFVVGVGSLTFSPKELGNPSKRFPMRLSMLGLEGGKATTSYAGVYTRNGFPGAPVVVGRKILEDKSPIGGVLINNKVSNVHPRGGGVNDALALSSKAAELLRLPGNVRVVPASTGVIGWALPVPEMMAELSNVVKGLAVPTSALPLAEAIMTTDAYPKARTREVKLKSGARARVTGVAKGAGMIEPNMATMLVYVMTDAKLPSRDVMQDCLTAAVNGPGSFNCITVDSDQSTSDMALLISSDRVPAEAPEDVAAFSQALNEVCADLAEDVVRNGEGTRHVIRVEIVGAPSLDLAKGCGKAIANSPLVKTAIYGNDPNVGRIIAALGSYLGRQQSLVVAKALPKRTRISVGGVVVFENGVFQLDPQKEAELQALMKRAELKGGEFPSHFRNVDIKVELFSGDAAAVVVGSDLSEKYVETNADYRS